MGSPSARLNIDEKYRPWVDAGLQFIFAPGGVRQMKSEHEAEQVNAPTSNVAQRTQNNPQPESTRKQAVRQSSTQNGKRRQESYHNAPQISRPTAHFAEPWNSFLQKIKVHTPQVVCTYMELGLDLGGMPDPKRRSVLKNTLTDHLKWPPGTAAFWPMSALVDGVLQSNQEMFWKGWNLWKTPYVVCFGEDALRGIHPSAQIGGTTFLFNDVTILVAPPLATLVTKLPHEQQLSTEMLSAIRI